MNLARLYLKFLISFLFFAFFVTSTPSQNKSCETISEDRKIEILLKRIGNFDGSFIRNGDLHKPKEAENHLRYKLKEAKNSFFAPDPKDWTAKLFIEKIATKSFLSGTPYQIRDSKGKDTPASTWLYQELKKIELCQSQ